MALEFIYRRHSVRQFKPDPVPQSVLRELIQAATAAPSGKNLQNWHFVAVTDQAKIAEIARLVQEKNAQLSAYIADEAQRKSFQGTVGYHTIFKSAPMLMLVYAGPYPNIGEMLLTSGKMPREEALRYFKPDPAIQNIAAALENFHLAAASLGYGTCWMTGPTYAAEEISDYLDFHKEGYHLAAMTPVGLPASDRKSSTPRKPIEEVLTIIS